MGGCATHWSVLADDALRDINSTLHRKTGVPQRCDREPRNRGGISEGQAARMDKERGTILQSVIPQIVLSSSR